MKYVTLYFFDAKSYETGNLHYKENHKGHAGEFCKSVGTLTLKQALSSACGVTSAGKRPRLLRSVAKKVFWVVPGVPEACVFYSAYQRVKPIPH